MPQESRLSKWARRAVVIAASLATIATSRAKWSVEATLPPPPTPGPQGTLVTVEASHEPSVSLRLVPKTGGGVSDREERTPWGGRGTYYLPPRHELSAVSIEGFCSGGLCDKCVVPPGAFVRVVNEEPVEPWTLSVTSSEQTTRIASPSAVDLTVTFATTRRVVLDVAPADPASVKVEAFPWGGDPLVRPSFRVSLQAPGATAEAPREVRWVVKGTISGFCREKGECKPPPSESLRIESIK